MLRLKKPTVVFAALMLLGGLVVIAMATDTTTQDVTVEVTEIDSISTTGTIGTLSISVFDTDVTDTGTTMDYSTNATASRKITAELDSNYSSGITLNVKIQDGEAAGVDVSTTAGNVVTGITAGSVTGKTITYTASASAGTGQVSETKTVTFTILAE